MLVMRELKIRIIKEPFLKSNQFKVMPKSLFFCLLFLFFLSNASLIFADTAYVFTGKHNVSISSIDSIQVDNLTFDEQQIVGFAVLNRYSNRIALLTNFYKKLENSEEWLSVISLYSRFSQLTKISQLRLLAEKGNKVADQLLRIEDYSIQKPESLSFLGPALNSALIANQLLTKPITTSMELQKVVELLQLALTDQGDLPFGQQLLFDLPVKLSENSLPLEAAIIARALQRQVPNQNIEKNVSNYLLLAGDFKGALKAKEALDPMLFRNSTTAMQAMNWLILGKDYKSAFDIHSKYLTNAKPTGIDAWTGLSLSRDLLRVRSAGIINLLGNSKEAFLSLENLTRDRQFDSDTGYARLMQAQLLFEEKLDLAEQVAEDITFKAQENDHYRLEYFATVLDGLALQKQGKDYLAWINFTKAQGIAWSHLRNSSPSFHSLYLGQMLAGLKLMPNTSKRPLTEKLLLAEDDAGDHSAIWLFQDMLPVGHNPLLWKQALINNLAQRKQNSELAWLLQRFLERQRHHRNNANPGGITGLNDVLFWSRLASQNLLNQDFKQLPKQANFNLSNVRSASEARIQNSFTDGALFLISTEEQTLWITIHGSSSQIETGLVKTICIQPMTHTSSSENDSKECSESQQTLKQQLSKVKTVFFSSGYLPDFNLIDETHSIDWRVVLPPSSVINSAVNNSDLSVRANPKFQICATPKLSKKDAVFSESLPNKASSVLIGRFRFANDSQGPLYLSRLSCGSPEIRLWDFDRFSVLESSTVIVSPSESVAGSALAYLTGRWGATFIEYDFKATGEYQLMQLMNGEKPEKGNYRVIQASHL